MTTTNTVPAVGYVRPRTAEHAEGYGLDIQRERIGQFARAERLRLVAVCEDPGVSGTVPLDERPGLSGALQLVQEGGAATLIVANPDRFARDAMTALVSERLFEDAGAAVRCADGCNGEADELRFLRQVLQSVAELQKRQLVARLAAGRRLKAVRGGYAGGRPPFGYRARGGALVPDEEQAQVVRWVFERAADGWSTRRITAALDAKRTLGRGWTVTTISRMLNRRAYKLGPPGARIVDPRVWNRASAVLTAHRPMMF